MNEERDRLDHSLRERFKAQLTFLHRHLLLTILVAALVIPALIGIAFWSGFFAGEHAHYDARYFETHYTLNEPHPPLHSVGLPALPQTPPPQSSAYLPQNMVPSVYDQGQVGQCECYAFKLQFEALFFKRNHRYVQISCRFLYSLVTQGQDVGSSLEQYVQALQQTGWVDNATFPYSGTPYPSELQYPLPSNLLAQAAFHRYQLGVAVVSDEQGGGQNAIDQMEWQIAHERRPVNFGAPVFQGSNGDNSFYDAQNGVDTVDIPTHTNPVLAGYHATTIIGYDRNRCETTSAGRTCGWALLQNNWNRYWGVNCQSGTFTGTTSGGCAWVSYRFIRQYGFMMDAIKFSRNINPRAPLAAPPIPKYLFIPSHGPTYNIAPKGFLPTLKAGIPWYVQGVVTHDTGLDLTALINQTATAHGISPVGMTALLATESGINQYADRYGLWPDVSFGVAQFTVQTAASYGVCSDTVSCRAWLNNPYNAIPLAAVFLHQLAVQTCTDFPRLYLGYNQGGGYGCGSSAYSYPGGQAAANYSNFLANYGYVISRYGTSIPPHKVVPKKTVAQICGKRIGSPRLFGRGQGRFYKARWSRCRAVFTWPGYRWVQKIVRR